MNKKTATTVLTIQGMSCASCISRVEKALAGISGVESVNVNLATHRALIHGDAPVAALISAVKQAGYKAAVHSGEPTLTFSSKGQLVNFLAALALVIPLLAVKVFSSDFDDSEIVQMLLAFTILAIPGRRFFIAAIKQARRLQANMDTLVAIGSFTAFAFSTARVLLPPAEDHLYFETAGMIVTLILLGRFLEARAKARASTAISELMGLRAATALKKTGDNWVEVPVESVEPGDFLMVRPGARVPVDGKLMEGEARIDESMITGESMPAHKTPGAAVIGATVNRSGSFIMSAEKIGADTMLSHIIRLVETAQSSRAPSQRLADKVAGVFVPLVIAVAVVTFVLWIAIEGNTERAIKSAVAVLVIACPCAMGLAAPTAILVGTGVAARQGILVRDAAGFELAHKVETLVFDKTGTLTQGTPAVTRIKKLSDFSEDELFAKVASCEIRSEHPFAQAIIEEAGHRNLDLGEVTDFEPVAGFGIRGVINGEKICIGSRIFLMKNNIDVDLLDTFAEEIESEGATAIYIGVDGMPTAIIGISDPLRATSSQSLAELRAMKIKTVLASGDNLVTTRSVGKQTGIIETHGSMRPDDKIELIKKEKSRGKIVGMVGDGINDAPALAAADVGFAMGGGTDIAMETAAITLVQGDISRVTSAIRISRSTVRTIRQNLFWAFAYNTLAIPVAAFGALHPMIAAGTMALSSVMVIGNSLRLRRLNPK